MEQSNTFSQSTSPKTSATSANTSTPKSEPQSLTSAIVNSFGDEDRESIKKLLAEVNGWMKTGLDYVNENPKEAAVLGVSAGIVGYILLRTKPGLKIFEVSALAFAPQIAKWISANFGATKH